MSRAIIALLLTAGCGFGQHISIGVKGGVRLTDLINGGFADSESKFYTVGPMIDISLPLGFAVEGDVLYNRFGYSSTSTDILGGTTTSRVRANSWEFPLLAKYRLGLPLLKPYIAGGIAARVTNGSGVTTGVQVDALGRRSVFSPLSYAPNFDSARGVVAGVGVEFGAGRIRVSPELRYTRWTNKQLDLQGSRGFQIHSTLNEVKALVGITWRR